MGALVFFAKDAVAKMIFTSAVRGLTGLPTQVEKLQLDLLQGVFQVEGLVLLNPYEFEERIFADSPEIYFQMDLPALFKGEKIHIHEIRLNLRELNVEKNERGVSNLSQLTALAKSGRRKEASPSPQKKIPFQLDRFELTLRRVSYRDRSGVVPKKLSVDAHVEKQVFEGITDAKTILRIILMKAVSESPIGNLGVNAAELQNQIKRGVRSTREFGVKLYEDARSAEITQKTGEAGKKVYTAGKEKVGEVGAAAKEEITGLFGKIRSKIDSDESETF